MRRRRRRCRSACASASGTTGTCAPGPRPTCVEGRPGRGRARRSGGETPRTGRCTSPRRPRGRSPGVHTGDRTSCSPHADHDLQRAAPARPADPATPATRAPAARRRCPDDALRRHLRPRAHRRPGRAAPAPAAPGGLVRAHGRGRGAGRRLLRPSARQTPLGELRTSGVTRPSVPFAAPFGAMRACLHVDRGTRRDRAPRPPARRPARRPAPGRARCSSARAFPCRGDDEGFSAGSHQFDSDITAGRYPRAAIGVHRDGRSLAVACDGRADDEAA